MDPNEHVKIVLPYAILFRNYEEIEHEFERGVFIPGIPYSCKELGSDINKEDGIENVRTAAFVLVQEK